MSLFVLRVGAVGVKDGETAYFQPTEPQPGPATITTTAGLEPVAEDATVKLRLLAHSATLA